MHLMYVDECGDTGVKFGSSPHFIVTGIIMNETDWNKNFGDYKILRRKLYKKYQFPISVELKGDWLLKDRKKVYQKYNLDTPKRISIYKDVLDFINDLSLKIINVYVTKNGKKKLKTKNEIQETGYKFLIQRFENFLNWSAKDFGIVIYDGHPQKSIRSIQRKCRVFNPVPSRFEKTAQKIPITNILEDPLFKESHFSSVLQIADLVAYSVKCKFIKFKGRGKKYNKYYQVQKFFNKLNNVILRKASTEREDGIVIYD